MTRIIAIIVGLFIIFAGIVLALNYFDVLPSFFTKKTTVTIKEQAFTTEVATTEKQQQIGLSNKSSFDDNEAMLFTFPKADYYSFWMKNMNFPIDIIYIRDNKIVTIYKDVPAPPEGAPDEQLTIYKPTEPADMVFETKAGIAEKYSFQIGDTVTTEL